MMTVAQLEPFLTRYRAFVSDRQEERLTALKNGFQRLIFGYKICKARLREQDRYEARRFNIFSILKVEWAETKTHSPFLANLLNPHGSHGQGELFLHSFVDTFLPRTKASRFLEIDPKFIQVVREKHTGDGYIDLWIQSRDPLKPFQIGIENKLNAGDQNRQLARYKDFLSREYPQDDWSTKMLIYLCPDGRTRSKQSISDSEIDELGIESFIQINYHHDVYSWITDCLSRCKSRKVSEILNQYVETINLLKL